MGRHLPTISGGHLGMEGVLTVAFHHLFADNWNERGFIALEGRPILSRLPLVAPSQQIYANHPPLSHWLIYLGVKCFGMNKVGFRFMPTLFTALTAFLLAFYATKKQGPWAGLGVGVMWSAIPMTYFYGRCSNFEPFTVFFGVAALMASTECKSRSSFAASLVLWFLAGMVDWAALFLAVSYWFAQKGRNRAPRFQAKHAVTAVIASFAAYFLLLSYWEGSVIAAIDNITKAAELGARNPTEFNWPGFYHNQKLYWLYLMSTPGLILAVGGISVATVQIVRRRASKMLVIIAAWLLASIINVFVFLDRSINHEFWWYYAIPGMTLFAGIVLARVAKVSRIVAVLILLASVFSCFQVGMKTYRNKTSPRRQAKIAQFDERFGEDTLILDAYVKERGGWMFSTKAQFYFVDDNLTLIHDLVRRFGAKEFTVTRLVIWYPAKIDLIRTHELKWFKLKGAIHQVEGDSAFLIFE